MKELTIKKYMLSFTGTNKNDVSFTLNPNDINKKVESVNDNIIYIVLNGRKVLYIGEAKTSIKTRLTRGFAVYRRFNKHYKSKNGYKGYKWIDLFSENIKSLEIIVIILDKLETEEKNKKYRESIEGELCWLFRLKNEWPTHQNEIHFHNIEEAITLAEKIYNQTIN